MFLKRMQNSFVITGPSGVGKSVIIGELFKHINNIAFSVSVTTRKKRAGEVDGVNYHFISQEEFLEKVKNNEFAEHVKVFENYYGTLLSSIENNNTCNDLIFDLEIQGARKLKQAYEDKITSIFILPPNSNAQKERLQKRNDCDQTFNQRVGKLEEDVANLKEYDYIIVNDILEESVKALASIILATRLSKKSIINLDEVVNYFKS